MAPYEDYLTKIYYDPAHPAAYAGVDKLYRTVKKEGKFVLGRQKIRNWLLKQEDYAVHKEERKFKRRRVVAPFVDYQWDVDTADMSAYVKENDAMKYFLLVIDLMSKYVWTVPLRTKTGKEMVDAFKRIFAQGRQPTRIRSDKGSEFANKDVKKYLKDQGVGYFVTQNLVKASFAERAIKTVKSRLAHYMSHKETRHWVDVLSKITDSYNDTYHRTIKRAPAKVKASDSVALWKLIYQPKPRVKVEKTKKPPRSTRKFRFKVGDLVRISFLRRPFQRQYDERWSRELFVVTERFMVEGIPQYKLKDYGGDVITGTFYQNQMNRAYEQEVYKVEKVIRSRGKAGRKDYLVRWKGWGPKYDSWIKEDDLKSINSGNKTGTSS